MAPTELINHAVSFVARAHEGLRAELAAAKRLEFKIGKAVSVPERPDTGASRVDRADVVVRARSSPSTQTYGADLLIPHSCAAEHDPLLPKQEHSVHRRISAQE